MKTERELFLRYWTDNNLPYDGDDDDMKVAWTVWQASAQREGYRIVPVEPTIAMVRAYYETPKPTAERCYKAMIGVIG